MFKFFDLDIKVTWSSPCVFVCPKLKLWTPTTMSSQKNVELRVL